MPERYQQGIVIRPFLPSASSEPPSVPTACGTRSLPSSIAISASSTNEQPTRTCTHRIDQGRQRNRRPGACLAAIKPEAAAIRSIHEAGTLICGPYCWWHALLFPLPARPTQVSAAPLIQQSAGKSHLLCPPWPQLCHPPLLQPHLPPKSLHAFTTSVGDCEYTRVFIKQPAQPQTRNGHQPQTKMATTLRLVLYIQPAASAQRLTANLLKQHPTQGNSRERHRARRAAAMPTYAWDLCGSGNGERSWLATCRRSEVPARMTFCRRHRRSWQLLA